MPHEKQEGKGWDANPTYDAVAARASSGLTGSTSVTASWLQRADITGLPSYDATTPPSSAGVTDSGTSRGGGACSETLTAGHGSAWSLGQLSPAWTATAPALQPPLPDDGGPRNRDGTTTSQVRSGRSGTVGHGAPRSRLTGTTVPAVGGMGHNDPVSDLIDTTEMYLRTIYELVEEGIVPLRARIAERLHQSGPTVSQTVARMERDGLVTVEGDRHLELTAEGHRLATRVMRKHRLAERLLTDVIGLDWELVHAEACRWEHVMSETVERRLLDLLDHPTESPYGNPIPGLSELGEERTSDVFLDGMEPLSDFAGEERATVRVRRISEELQKDEPLMGTLRRIGALPDKVIAVVATDAGVLVGSGGETAELDLEAAGHIFVSLV